MPWVPSGPSQQHQHCKGIPSRQEQESARRAAEAARAAATEREARLSARLDDADAAMSKLESTIEGVVADFEAHVIGATSASVLIQKRLEELGLAS